MYEVVSKIQRKASRFFNKVVRGTHRSMDVRADEARRKKYVGVPPGFSKGSSIRAPKGGRR